MKNSRVGSSKVCSDVFVHFNFFGRNCPCVCSQLGRCNLVLFTGTLKRFVHRGDRCISVPHGTYCYACSFPPIDSLHDIQGAISKVRRERREQGKSTGRFCLTTSTPYVRIFSAAGKCRKLKTNLVIRLMILLSFFSSTRIVIISFRVEGFLVLEGAASGSC